jgi:uncharacterized protein YjiS (DUF1127 family)
MKPSYETFYENMTTPLVFLPVKESRNRFILGLRRVREVFSLYWQNYRTRQQLSRLNADQLDDIGITVAQVRQEASQPFWK